MSQKGFTHLHVHSEYSLLDGAASVKKLVKQCQSLGMESLALTDHGNMYGATAFYSAAKNAGIKPLIGMEAYIAPGSRFDKDSKGISEAAYHLLLVAKDLQGYQNLIKLSTQGYTEGFYYRPRIDFDLLTEYKEGLICTTACLGGEIPSLLSNGQFELAEEIAKKYLQLFGDENFFIELQWHCDDQNAITPLLADLAKKVGAPMVATNDVHFLEAADYRAHAVLTCISTGKTIEDEKRMVYPPELYLKSPEEMRIMFPQWQEACDNTTWIAERCNVEIDFKTRHAPTYHPPKGKTDDEYLEELCMKGLKKRYGKLTPEVKDRIEHELKVIKAKHFSSYFLIVWDFVNFARQNGIPANPRGSGVGTLVGYALEISHVDPLRYGLLFERFMDPERNEMPDIDIDICQDGRSQVIEYVQKKYGHVAQITTFGTMKARAVIRDVCRAMNVPLAEADKLAKLIPEDLGITLEEALEKEPRLKEWYDGDSKVHDVVEIAKRLEGLTRHCSVHACAVVIADEPLTKFLPLYVMPGTSDLITQFDGPLVEKVGLLKMDFLGLRTLSVIERARKLVRENKGIDVNPYEVDLKDPKTLELFCAGRTRGVFQFESGGMQELLQSMKPDRIEDLIAANALYRPGPMTLIPDYNARKHGQPWSSPHPIMEEVLKETYGIMIYQEQVMQILNQLGGMPLARAYKLIKAISKKKEDIINAESGNFIDGCVEKGIKRAKAEELFALIQRFAGYGFNKSHSTQYAILAFQTAYFKAHYPTEFMAALLTYEMGSIDKVAEYIEESRQLNIQVLPPDVNESNTDFTAIYKKARKGADPETTETEPSSNGFKAKGESIRFGLAAVKGVGTRAVEELIRARDEAGRFENIYHLCQFIDTRVINRGALEALIKAGAMDSLGGSRPQLLAALDDAITAGNKIQQDRRMGQMNLFEIFDSNAEIKQDAVKMPNVAPWPESLMLQYEKDVLGMYVTSHPLAQYAERIHYYSTANTGNLSEKPANTEVIIGGIVSRVRYTLTKKGRGAGSRMAMITMEDLNGTVDGVVFPDTLALYDHLIQPDKMVFLRGMIDTRRENPSIRINGVYDMTRAAEELTHSVYIQLTDDHIHNPFLHKIKTLITTHPGRCPVYVGVSTDQNLRVIIQLKNGVMPDNEFCRKLDSLVSHDNYRLLRPHDKLNGNTLLKNGNGKTDKSQSANPEPLEADSPETVLMADDTIL